ncbi:MAG: DNA polymerase ligase N-terminal domain-containing protein [Bacillota bacterium]
MKLEDYRGMRDLKRSGEPDEGGTGGEEADPIFVVQEHHASSLHYDFRLEHDGVLLSWAIPKGPSLDPGKKRLAVMVEDHPVSYADFEGVIREGEYGAGTVVVWDRGTYETSADIDAALEDGFLEVELLGQKLRGGWALVKFRGRDEDNWLLVKKDDEHANRDIDILGEKPESVLSGLTAAELTQRSGETASEEEQ